MELLPDEVDEEGPELSLPDLGDDDDDDELAPDLPVYGPAPPSPRARERQKRQERLLDDVPYQVKKRLREREPEPQFPMEAPELAKRLKTSELGHFAMVGASEGELRGVPVRANEWLPRLEVGQLAELMGIPLTSVRLHRALGRSSKTLASSRKERG